MRLLALCCPALCSLALLSSCSRSSQSPGAQQNAQPNAPIHSKVTLLLEQSAAQPGAATRVALQFQMENNWHIYWLNPGDSGEPPSVRWRLPQGITASALLWPTPTRLTTTAGTDYGYRGSAVLLSTLTIPATVQPGSAPPIVADVRWLVCHDICVPQQAQVSATLPIAAAKDGSAVDATVQPLFAAATQQLPKPIPAAFQLFASSASSTAFRLSFIAPYQLASAIFFPANSEQIDNSAPQQLVQDRNTTHLDLKKSDYLQRDPERLQGVLVLNQISYAIDVPVHKSAPRSPALSKEGQP